MSKHTPGPWRCKPICESGWVDIVANDPTRSAYEVASARHEHAVANARLIAAGPTMYEFIARKAQEGDADAAAIITAINA